MQQILTHSPEQYFAWHIALKGYRVFKDTNIGAKPINKASLFHAYPQFKTKPLELMVELQKQKFIVEKISSYEQD